jgi:hypothetical protein
VATAIDIETGDGLVLTPAEDARTGGDPAPWGTSPAQGDAAIVLPRVRPFDEVLPQQPSIDPDAGSRAPDPQGRPTDIENRPPDAESPSADARPEARRPDSSTPAADPGTPGGDVQLADAAARPSSQPWLTRTDDTWTPPSQRDPKQARPPEAPQQRPAADLGSSGGPRGRSMSRSEEIHSSGDRPWIALPIEPFEPPERPGR